MIYNIGVQLACICVLTVLYIYFFTRRRLPTHSMKQFKILCIFSYGMLIFDIATVLTISNYETVDKNLNMLVHRFYYVFTGFILLSLFRYLYTLSRSGERFCVKQMLVGWLPCAVCTVLEIVLPIEFNISGTTRYSTGPAVYALYANVLIYLGLSLYRVLKYRKNVGAQVTVAVSCAVLIYMLFAVIQFFVPTLLLASLANVLVAVLLFLTLENPNDHLDKHTGAFNRDGFLNLVSSRFLSKKSFSIGVIEIDGFSRISSTLGIDAAEKIMLEICDSIRLNYKLISRIDASTLAIVIVGDKMKNDNIFRSIYDRLHEPYTVNGIAYKLSPYACCLTCPADASTVNEVMDSIKYCLIEAKSNGKSAFITFDEHMAENRRRYNHIVEVLNKSIDNDDIQVYYQPILDVKTEKFTSAEALVRLHDKELGVILPEEFIPISEKTGLILKLGLQVFERVCRLVSEKNIRAMGIESININLSGVQCMQANLSEQLSEMMTKYNIRPNMINLEITETAAVNSDDVLIDSMGKMISKGSTFALDDYGSGYSSMGYIIKFPFSQIKLDKSIVWSYFNNDNEKSKIVMDSNISMIKNLNMSVVAEGVETGEQAAQLAKLGVDYLQGFYFAKPQPQANFINFLREKNCQ